MTASRPRDPGDPPTTGEEPLPEAASAPGTLERIVARLGRSKPRSTADEDGIGTRSGGRAAGFFRMDALVPFMIAVVSLVGAAVTWRASDVGAGAGGLDGQVLRDTIEVQQIRRQIDAVIAHDQRIFAAYQAHIHAWRDLELRAEAAEPRLARTLRADAQAQLAMARTLRPMFRALLPDFGDDAGAVTYDEDFARTSLEGNEARLLQLDPEGTLVLAAARHQHAVALVAVVIVLVAALFLLTLAQLGRGLNRVLFGSLGSVAAVVAAGAFVAIEITAR